MSDALSDVCSRIRQAIAHPSALSVEQIAELLRLYNSGVDEVNDRFRRAQSWLRRGLRAEALGLIEEWPDALESARMLELGGGWGQWADMVVQADVGEARAIDAALAGELNEAYDLHQSTLPLLVEYRRAAMLAFPPQQQIGILRRLRAADPSNPVWLEQLRGVEELYLSMLNRQAKTALNNQDYEGLLRILEVSRSSEWAAPPPPAFVAKLEQSVRQLRSSTAASRFMDIASRLHEAFGAFDEGRIERLVAEWNETATTFSDCQNEELSDTVAPIFEWWRERLADRSREHERERLQAQLAQQLDESAPLHTLEQTRAALDRLEVDIQPALERRYRLRIDTLVAARRRRSRMILAGATAGTLCVAAAIGYTLLEQGRSRAIERFVGSVGGLLAPDSRDLEGAERAFEDARGTSPWMFRDPRVIELRANLEREIAAFNEERKAFDAAFELVASLSFDDPQAWEALERAESLAPEDQKRGVQIERDRLEARLAEFASSIAGAHAADREALIERYRETMDDAASLGTDERNRLLKERLEPIEGELAELIAGAQGDSKEWPSEHVRAQVARVMQEPLRMTRTALEEVQSERAEALDEIRMVARRNQHLQRIELTRGRTDLLSGDLRAFIDAHPAITNDPTGEAPIWFSSVLEHEAAWLAAKAWNELGASIRTHGAEVGSPTAAQERAALVAKLLEHAPGHGEVFADYNAYLLKAQSVLGENGRLTSFLALVREEFQRPLYSQMTWVEAAVPGEWAYSMAPAGTRLRLIQRENSVYDVPALVRLETETQPDNIAALQTVPRKLRGGDDVVLETAGHVQAARMVLARFDELERGRMSGWDRALLEISIAIRDHPMDEMIRLDLIRAMLTRQIDVAWLAASVGPIRASLEALEELHGLLRYDKWPSSDANEEAGRIANADRAKVREALGTHMPDLEAIRDSLRSGLDTVQGMRVYESAAIVWFDAEEPRDESRRIVSGTTSFGGLHWLTLVEGHLTAHPVEVGRDRLITNPSGLPPGTPLFRVNDR